MEASITFKSVAKKIKADTLLADLSFGVEKGTRFSLVGPNGSGKSTIIKLLSGILHKDKGSIYIKGYDINIRTYKIKSIIGYMSQVVEFDNNMNIFDNISIYGQLHGINRSEISKKIVDLSKKLDFDTYLYNYPLELSYGLLRVIMFARSIIHNPEILLLDEPVANIDPLYKEKIWNYICRDLSEITIFFATNNFNDAQEYSHRIAILYQGNIKYNGTFKNLVKSARGLAKFTISFRDRISEQLVKNISLNPQIIEPKISDHKLEFYSVNKTEYFKILKFSLDSEIDDIDISKCTLEDIFKGIDSKEEK
tara:strand:+ start:577 stop:1503 length:927 start_codon:yes stop_codon:yes gene_type:complete